MNQQGASVWSQWTPSPYPSFDYFTELRGVIQQIVNDKRSNAVAHQIQQEWVLNHQLHQAQQEWELNQWLYQAQQEWELNHQLQQAQQVWELDQQLRQIQAHEYAKKITRKCDIRIKREMQQLEKEKKYFAKANEWAKKNCCY